MVVVFWHSIFLHQLCALGKFFISSRPPFLIFRQRSKGADIHEALLDAGHMASPQDMLALFIIIWVWGPQWAVGGSWLPVGRGRITLKEG